MHEVIAVHGGDARGVRDRYMNLSETRARNVMKFMIRSGFDPKRLIIEYKGEDDPVVSNDSGERKYKNRRVELRLKN